MTEWLQVELAYKLYMVRMLYAASKRESLVVLFDLLLVFCKEHLYSLCGSWLLLPRSLKHQPSRLNFNTGSAKDYKMVAHNSRCQNSVNVPFSHSTDLTSCTFSCQNKCSSFRALQRVPPLKDKLASELHHHIFGAFSIVAMSSRGRFSIWKDDPALDSWYNAAVNRNFIPRNSDDNPVEEILFFGIPKSNQVSYPSGASHEWFYDASMGHSTIMESKFRLQMFPVMYLTLFSTYSFTDVEYSRIDPAWPQIQQTYHRQTSASSS